MGVYSAVSLVGCLNLYKNHSDSRPVPLPVLRKRQWSHQPTANTIIITRLFNAGDTRSLTARQRGNNLGSSRSSHDHRKVELINGLLFKHKLPAWQHTQLDIINDSKRSESSNITSAFKIEDDRSKWFTWRWFLCDENWCCKDKT